MFGVRKTPSSAPSSPSDDEIEAKNVDMPSLSSSNRLIRRLFPPLNHLASEILGMVVLLILTGEITSSAVSKTLPSPRSIYLTYVFSSLFKVIAPDTGTSVICINLFWFMDAPQSEPPFSPPCPSPPPPDPSGKLVWGRPTGLS